ncbi:MAG TPA: multidrug transporter [Bacteroidia bacterium]|nr:multidrug transporter [Bacteroidia bacterium]
MAKTQKVKIYKEADKGRIVSKEYADKHPKTTFLETTKRNAAKSPKKKK